jgi:hypothetical protein
VKSGNGREFKLSMIILTRDSVGSALYEVRILTRVRGEKWRGLIFLGLICLDFVGIGQAAQLPPAVHLLPKCTTGDHSWRMWR